ncbi:MAG: transporter substrate-binding domain-containing protein, partial [Bacteroidales bacterium]|nr:transporter substrate-binding domain-containing protein [Bacteroidales bacterium]
MKRKTKTLHHKWKRFLFAIILIRALGVIPGYSHAPSLIFSTEKYPDSITIASEPDYPPYCFVDKEGNPQGFAVELFKAAAEVVGIYPTIKIGIWNRIKQDLAEGNLQALPLVGRTPEREKDFDFTMPYLSLHGAIFVRNGTTAIQSTDDLKEKEIIVMQGDNAEEFVIREKISDKIITTNTFEEAFRLLAAGKHDAVITQHVMGSMLLKELSIKNVKSLDIPLPEFRQDFCFAVRKGDTLLLSLLNEGLSVIIANNTYETIRNKWFGPEYEKKIAYGELLKNALLIIIPILILAGSIMIFLMRIEIRRKTQKINMEIAERNATLKELNKKQIIIQESEEKIRLLLNSTAEGIFGIDIHGNCTFYNNAAIRFLNIPKNRKIIGANIHTLTGHKNGDGTPCDTENCIIYQSITRKKGTHSDNEIFERSDGISFFTELFSYPIFTENGISGAVVTFKDITQRKKQEQELMD